MPWLLYLANCLLKTKATCYKFCFRNWFNSAIDPAANGMISQIQQKSIRLWPILVNKRVIEATHTTKAIKSMNTIRGIIIILSKLIKFIVLQGQKQKRWKCSIKNINASRNPAKKIHILEVNQLFDFLLYFIITHENSFSFPVGHHYLWLSFMQHMHSLDWTFAKYIDQNYTNVYCQRCCQVCMLEAV